MAAPSSERKGSSSGSQSTMNVAQRDGHMPDANNLYPGEKSDEEKAPPTPEEPVVADGGTVAWLVVLGAWCVSFCSFGWINSM